MADIEDLVQAARDAVDATTENRSERAKRFTKLALHLHSRYISTGNFDDLEEAVRICQQGLDDMTQNDPDRFRRLIHLSIFLTDRFKQTETLTDLESAISVTREAVGSTPSGFPNQAIILNKLAFLLGIRYTKTSSMIDIDEAIRIEQQNIERAPSKHSQHLLGWMNNLSAFLSARYQRAGAIADLDEAIQICRSLVDSHPADSLMRTKALSDLGSLFSERYLGLGEIVDLDEAIDFAKLALASIPSDHPERSATLTNLANFLGDRCLRKGVEADLEEAIQLGEEALKLSLDSERRAIALSNHAIQLSRRYDRKGTITDLDKAFQLGFEAIEISTDGQRAKCLHNLVIIHKNRYHITLALEYLAKAIDLQQQAIQVIPRDQPDFVVYLHSFCALQTTKFTRTGLLSDLEEAYQTSRQVVDSCPKYHPKRAEFLNHLGILLGKLFSMKRTASDLEEAVQVGQESVDATAEDNPQRAARLVSLGDNLRETFMRNRAMVDIERAIACHQAALHHLPSFTIARINAGKGLLRCCAAISDWQQAFEAAHFAMQLVPLLTSALVENRDKQDMLSNVTGLASDAAAMALNAGKGAPTVLCLLEQGRDLLAPLSVETQTDVLELQERNPELAERFMRLRDELKAQLTSATGEPYLQAQASRPFTAGEELNELIGNICKQPGGEGFLHAPTETNLRKAAMHGPIVMINVSEYRCDALLVEQHQMRSLALPFLNDQDLRSKIKSQDLGTRKILEWLWDSVACPVLNALGFNRSPLTNKDLPHIWWIPTGIISIMPLHAAGRHHHGSTETVVDRAISSYSTSIRAMIRGRQQRSGGKIVPFHSKKAVLVGMEHTPEYSRLFNAPREISMLHGLCKSMGLDPTEPRRRKQDVLLHLSQCKIFHFAGHGSTDEHDPSKSSLLLEDWQTDPLTLASVQDINLWEQRPFLAYLSACGTGQVRHERFIDENLHLISGYQMAGFCHVIGTLWEVSDEHSVDMARMTYEGIQRGALTDDSVCRGLHEAMKLMRDRWLSRLTSVGRMKRRLNKAVEDLDKDGGNLGLEDNGNKDDSNLPRNIEPDDSEDDEGDQDDIPLHWVPYVHYGV